MCLSRVHLSLKRSVVLCVKRMLALSVNCHYLLIHFGCLKYLRRLLSCEAFINSFYPDFLFGRAPNSTKCLLRFSNSFRFTFNTKRSKTPSFSHAKKDTCPTSVRPFFFGGMFISKSNIFCRIPMFSFTIPLEYATQVASLQSPRGDRV